MKNKSHTSILNNNGPGIEPWFTPDKISWYELHVPYVLVLCLRNVRQWQKNLTVSLSIPYTFSFAINKLCGRQSKTLKGRLLKPGIDTVGPSKLYFYILRWTIRKCWALWPCLKPHWCLESILSKSWTTPW